MNKDLKKTLIIAVAAAVAAGAAGFLIGYYLCPGPAGKLPPGAARNGRMIEFIDGQKAGAAGTRGGMQGGMVAGEISEINGNMMTVKLRNGGTRIILISEKTEVSKSAEGTKDDLATGASISVFGTANSDGSLTASSIQIRPLMENLPASGPPEPPTDQPAQP